MLVQFRTVDFLPDPVSFVCHMVPGEQSGLPLITDNKLTNLLKTRKIFGNYKDIMKLPLFVYTPYFSICPEA